MDVSAQKIRVGIVRKIPVSKRRAADCIVHIQNSKNNLICCSIRLGTIVQLRQDESLLYLVEVC